MKFASLPLCADVVFAALASLASIAILLHSVLLDPYSWFFIRVITGISLSGIYIIGSDPNIVNILIKAAEDVAPSTS